jgi:hypothetical protein
VLSLVVGSAGRREKTLSGRFQGAPKALGESSAVPGTAGNSTSAPASPIATPKRFRARAHPVNVEQGSTAMKGPYVAETIAVSVESDYVVVDL